MQITIGVTGPRHLFPGQRAIATQELKHLLTLDTRLHVGDALGLDQLARELARHQQICTLCYQAEGYQPWQLQQRSKRMVDALVLGNGTLHAWPNKPCPGGLTLSSWKGSGTWGTVRYALSKSVAVELHPLINLELPDWLEPQQKMMIW